MGDSGKVYNILSDQNLQVNTQFTDGNITKMTDMGITLGKDGSGALERLDGTVATQMANRLLLLPTVPISK